jgi:hypothetical protein
VGESASVATWRYCDHRTEEAKREKLQQLEAARLRLLEARQQQDQSDGLTEELTPEARKAVASTIEDKMNVMREITQLLNETSPQRSNEENSAYDIADAVLTTPDFHYINSPLALDGGNLFKLDDGRCLTTRVLLSRNKDQNLDVDRELQKTTGCKAVTYLEPLPGGVIEHVDMFALPAGGKRVLLASYDLSKPFAAEYWGQLSTAERDLALNADLAMQANAARLRGLGYEVVPVPSPYPRIPANGHTYYPAVLNVLLRTAADGRQQLLVPSFKDYETDIQSAALEQLKFAFGPHTEIITIEATEAAKSQGAIHCLTLNAPLALSIFGDSNESTLRSAALARKEQLDRKAADEVASQISAAGLQGSWAIIEAEQGQQPQSSSSASADPHPSSPAQPTEGASAALYPQRIFFGPSEFQRGVFDQLAYSGTYVIDERAPSSWSLHFVFADRQTTPAVAQWLNKDEVKLVLNHGDHIWLLHRLNSNPTSPFQSAQPPPQNTKSRPRGR